MILPWKYTNGLLPKGDKLKTLPLVDTSYKHLHDLILAPIRSRLLMAGIELGVFDEMDAFGLIAGSLWILVLYLPLAFYLAWYVIPREEAYMEREFGNDHRQYRQSVRRWL
jgi:hypothetical protein